MAFIRKQCPELALTGLADATASNEGVAFMQIDGEPWKQRLPAGSKSSMKVRSSHHRQNHTDSLDVWRE